MTIISDSSSKGNNRQPRIACSVGEDDAPWQRSDRRYFRRNKRRSHRIRKPYPGELAMWGLEVIPTDQWMLVRQIQPGERMRVTFPCDRRIPDNEDLLNSVFTQLVTSGKFRVEVWGPSNNKEFSNNDENQILH